MGGVEGEEPPSKRVKVASANFGGLSNGTHLREPASCSFSKSMARPLAPEGDDEVVGQNGVVRKAEFVRIIAEALYSLGYKKTGTQLEEESGIPLHSSAVNSFTQQVLDGKWDESVVTLHKIGLVDESVIKLASFVILEQKFFELLDGEKLMDALTTLRTEITPLCVNSDRLRELSSCIVSPTNRDLFGIPGQVKTRLKSRSKLLDELQRLLPPSVMIPEKRLVHLVEQALDLQRDACTFHNSFDKDMSLLTDHHCGRDHIPSHTLQVLSEHSDEVWHLLFSHNGKYLASSSNDCTVIIWEVEGNDRVSLKHRLTGHQKPVSYISWNFDDLQLLTCGVEEVVRRWDVLSGECLHTYEKGGLGLISCAWAPDCKNIFTGVNDKSIIMWNADGKELECWKGYRTSKISDLGLSSDGKQIITVCRDNVISFFGWESNDVQTIEEDQTIISFSLSKDRKFLLVSLLNQELHLWSIDEKAKLLAKYRGYKRSRFVVRSCFGGLEHSFIASGSEDSQVYIWHRSSGELVMTLPGHSGTVNCVSWNPANPHMLASASDDRTIRIWGLKEVKVKPTGAHSNGVHYCNGGS